LWFVRAGKWALLGTYSGHFWAGRFEVFVKSKTGENGLAGDKILPIF
jgi:hypothetical protein